MWHSFVRRKQVNQNEKPLDVKGANIMKKYFGMDITNGDALVRKESRYGR